MLLITAALKRFQELFYFNRAYSVTHENNISKIILGKLSIREKKHQKSTNILNAEVPLVKDFFFRASMTSF